MRQSSYECIDFCFELLSPHYFKGNIEFFPDMIVEQLVFSAGPKGSKGDISLLNSTNEASLNSLNYCEL